MIYDFRDVETGQIVGVDMPMAEAVSLGAIIEHEGRRLRRILSSPQIMVDKVKGSRQVAKNHPDAPRVDSQGFPVFRNKQERREFTKKHNARNLDSVLDVD